MAFSSPSVVLLLRQCQKLRSCVLGNPQMLSSVKLSPFSPSRRTYKAAVCTKIGAPIEIQEMKFPKKLNPSQVLISTHAAGINFADILIVKGKFQAKVETPFVPGMEVAGKIVEVGTEVTTCKPGDRVFALAFPKPATFAEYLVTETMNVFPVPDNLPLVNAAGTIMNYGTAMMALTRKAKLRKGEKVLVTAASGATGLAAVDIAKNVFKCEVIGVAGGAHKCTFLKAKGCDHVIDYSCEGIRDRVKAITDGAGVDVAMDQVGGETLVECVKSLGFEGRALTIGYASGDFPSVAANILRLKCASLMGCFWGNYSVAHPLAFAESIMETINAAKDDKIHPHVGKEFPLEQVNEAFKYVSDRRSSGKVVLRMRKEDGE